MIKECQVESSFYNVKVINYRLNMNDQHQNEAVLPFHLTNQLLTDIT